MFTDTARNGRLPRRPAVRRSLTQHDLACAHYASKQDRPVGAGATANSYTAAGETWSQDRHKEEQDTEEQDEDEDQEGEGGQEEEEDTEDEEEGERDREAEGEKEGKGEGGNNGEGEEGDD